MHAKPKPASPKEAGQQQPWPPFLQPLKEGVALAVKLQPRSSKNQIEGMLGQELRVKVTAPPVDAAANEALLRLLSEQLDCPRNAVQLLRGHTSRHKTILIRGLSGEAIAKRLQASPNPECGTNP